MPHVPVALRRPAVQRRTGRGGEAIHGHVAERACQGPRHACMRRGPNGLRHLVAGTHAQAVRDWDHAPGGAGAPPLWSSDTTVAAGVRPGRRARDHRPFRARRRPRPGRRAAGARPSSRGGSRRADGWWSPSAPAVTGPSSTPANDRSRPGRVGLRADGPEQAAPGWGGPGRRRSSAR